MTRRQSVTMSSASVTREPSWYAEWMIPGEESAGFRRATARKLLEDFQSDDSQSLPLLIEILNHELLCYWDPHDETLIRAREDCSSLTASSPSSNHLPLSPTSSRVPHPIHDNAFARRASGSSSSAVDSSSSNPFRSPSTSSATSYSIHNLLQVTPALDSEWVCTAVEVLSTRILNCVNASTNKQRALQTRALISALILLYAQGVESLQHEFYDRLYENLQSRFRDLQWLSGSSDSNLLAKHPKFQCDYLLSAAFEFASNFRRNQPRMADITSRTIHLLSFGTSVAVPALGVGGFNLANAISHLEAGFKPVAHSPNRERGAPLLGLQKLANVADALNLYAFVVKQNSLSDLVSVDLVQHSEELTSSILRQATITLKDLAFSNVRPPNSILQEVLASAKRGLSSISRYQFQFGFLDLITQLHSTGILRLSPEMKDILASVATKREEPSYRWKALECLLLGTPLEQHSALASRIFAQISPQARNRFKEEVNAMCRFLEYRPVILDERPTSIPSDNPPPSDNHSSRHTLSPSVFREPDVPVLKLSNNCSKVTHSCRICRKSKMTSAGLSPDCSHSFLCSKKGIYVAKLYLDLKTEPCRALVFEKGDPIVQQVALSNRLLGILTEKSLRVVHYRSSSRAPLKPFSAEVPFDEGRQASFVPRCFAIHDGLNGSLIVVAGQCDGPTLLLYDVSIDADDVLISARNFRHYERGHPDPLIERPIKSVGFDPDGEFLCCITWCNRIMIWFLGPDASTQDPFTLLKRQGKRGLDVQNITSSTVFRRSGQPYVLTTTWPSDDRDKYGGEYSFISAVGSLPCEVPPDLIHDLEELRDAKPILAGAASPQGELVALLERNGKIRVFSLASKRKGGIRTVAGNAKCGVLSERLCKPNTDTCIRSLWQSHGQSLRLCTTESGDIRLCAIDVEGGIVGKTFELPERRNPQR